MGVPLNFLSVTLLILWIPLSFAKDRPCADELVRVHAGKLVLSTGAIDLVIEAMSRAGWDLKPAALKKRDADVRALTLEQLGHQIGAEEFIKKAQFKYKNWTNAVAAVGGFDSGRTDWDRVDALGVLRDLAADGPVHLRAVKVLREERTVELLRARGVAAGAASFVDALLLRHENDWQRVLTAAGLDPLLAAHSTQVEWPASDLAEALRHIAAAYPGLQGQHLLARSQEIRTFLAGKMNRTMSGSSLYEQLVKTFESWYAALEYAGLDWRGVAASSQSSFGLTPFEEKKVFEALRQDGVSLHPQDFLTEHVRVHAITGLQALNIWVALKARYGSWPLALAALAPDYVLNDTDWLHPSVMVKQRVRVGATSQLADLRARLQTSVPEALGRALYMVGQRYPGLRYRDFVEHSGDIEKLVAGVVPGVNGKQLYRLLKDQFGLLSAALEYSGFEGRLLPNRSVDLATWTPQILSNLLRRLSEAGVSLSARDFLPNHKRIAELSALEFGAPVSAFSIWVAAHRLFESWPRAVTAACPDCAAGREAENLHPALWPQRVYLANRTLANPARAGERTLTKSNRNDLPPAVIGYLLRFLSERYPMMNAPDIERDGQDIAIWLHRELGQSVDGRDLVAHVVGLFGSWPAALQYAGFDTSSFVKPDKTLTWPKLIEIGKDLFLDGVSLRAEHFLLGGGAVMTTNGHRSRHEIWMAAVRHFGSWPAFLEQVIPRGFPTSVVDEHPAVWTERLTIETAQSRRDRERWVAVLDHSSLRPRFGPLLGRLKDYVLAKGTMRDRGRVETFLQAANANEVDGAPEPMVLALVLERLDTEFSAIAHAAE